MQAPQRRDRVSMLPIEDSPQQSVNRMPCRVTLAFFLRRRIGDAREARDAASPRARRFGGRFSPSRSSAWERVGATGWQREGAASPAALWRGFLSSRRARRYGATLSVGPGRCIRAFSAPGTGRGGGDNPIMICAAGPGRSARMATGK